MRNRTKSELKRLFTNLKRRAITDSMMSILIDALWPAKPVAKEYITEQLSGTVDGANRRFTTSVPYVAGTINCWLNGLKEHNFTEIDETTIEMSEAPNDRGFTDYLEANYQIK